MKENVLSPGALERVRGVHQLSSKYNKQLDKNHVERLLELMRAHIDEIEDLQARQDPHLFVETGDLVVLCFELLLEHGVSLDKTMLECFERYERKLGELMRGLEREKGCSGPQCL